MKNIPRPVAPALTGAVLVIAASLISLGGIVACTGGESEEAANTTETQLTPPSQALSEELMVALAQAKNFHHKADVHLKDAQLDQAIESVREILAIPFPTDAAEASDVILDGRARLAKLLVTRGDLDEAMSVANDGLRSIDPQSFFLANLFTVRGHVWEAFAQRADEAGDVEKGKQARRSALSDFDRSITINKAVLKRINKISKEPLK